MGAGARDRRLTLYRATLVEGGVTDSTQFIPLATVWAEYSPLSDSERFRADQIGSTVTDRFVILWRRDLVSLTTQDEAECDGRRFGIVAVKELGRRVEIEISAVAQASTAAQAAP